VSKLLIDRGWCIGVARIFSGVHFLLDQKYDDLFLAITLFYMVIYVIYRHQLHFYLICGVHLTKFSPIFASFQQKCLENFFFVALGVHLHPLHSLATPIGWWTTE